MRVMYHSNRMDIELEASDQKDLFKQLAQFQEVFEEKQCGACKSEYIRFAIRTVDDNEYYEMVCRACGAKLAYGQTKKNKMLFPKRRTDDGKLVENRGWTKWKGTPSPSTPGADTGNKK